MIYHHYINLPMETKFSIRIATKPKTRHPHSLPLPLSPAHCLVLILNELSLYRCLHHLLVIFIAMIGINLNVITSFFFLFPSPPHTHSIVNKHVKKREMTTIKMVLLFFTWHVSLLYVVTNKLLVMLFIAVVVVAVHHVHTHFHCRRC